jgi:hypothetical protein
MTEEQDDRFGRLRHKSELFRKAKYRDRISVAVLSDEFFKKSLKGHPTELYLLCLNLCSEQSKFSSKMFRLLESRAV